MALWFYLNVHAVQFDNLALSYLPVRLLRALWATSKMNVMQKQVSACLFPVDEDATAPRKILLEITLKNVYFSRC